MICAKHEIPMSLVCDTPSCGKCYEEELLSAPMPRFRQHAEPKEEHHETTN